jgi:HKD family nuclease
MQSRLLRGTNDLANEFRKWSAKAAGIRIVTAWATTDCIVCDSLKEARSKISTMVVGLDFYTTAPSFLESFHTIVRIGKALGKGTFHPKLYLFEDGGDFCCIMGSSNFTSGGFASNTELNTCIEGKTSDPFFSEVQRFIKDQEDCSDTITRPEIADYRDQFERLKASRVRLAKFKPSAAAKTKAQAVRVSESMGGAPPAQLNKTWPEFIGLLLAGERNGRVVGSATHKPGYLPTVERCGEIFQKHGRLANMPLADRQFVAGTTKGGGWFGDMRVAGRFVNRINDDPASLDAALDHVPSTGKMAKDAFTAFAANYRWERAGVGTASRLAAMKRPDLFICIDSKNRSGIAKAFDVSAVSLQTFEGYWDLIQRIWHCPWWRAAAPKLALHRRVWGARVALLDSLYYDEHS